MYSIEYDEFEAVKDNWDIAFVGTHCDDRDKASKGFLDKSTVKSCIVEYDLDELCLLIDDEIVQIHELCEWLKFCKGKKIVIDATSMTVAELFLISKHLYSLSIKNYEIIYVEPKEYTKSKEDFDLSDFDLSDYGIGFSGAGIPSLSVPFDVEERKHIVFLLGYEGDRFSDAMEAMQLKPEQVSLVFGVPSYKLNWEKNSYAGNIKVIEDNRLNDRFVFCGANNPLAVAREIKAIRKFHINSQVYIAPIGTKPQAIGCIPIVCNNNNESSTGVLWDHPKRKVGRTKGVSKIQITKKLFD